MVEIKELIESEYLNIAFCKGSASKQLVIVSEGEIIKSEKYGEKLVLDVEIDGKKKKWSINKPTAYNLVSKWGLDSKSWIGNTVSIMITKIDGNEMVLGTPLEVENVE